MSYLTHVIFDGRLKMSRHLTASTKGNFRFGIVWAIQLIKMRS